MNTRGNGLLSKIAYTDKHGEDSPYFDGWKAYNSDPFHPKDNPNGVIQMGLAENQLSSDLIVDQIKKSPKASICTFNGVDAFKEIANFQDYHGLSHFRKGIANFMEKVRGGRVKFDPDRIVMGGGATGANETIMFCLGDKGDAFLIPSPYYPGFDRDLRWRTGIQLVPVVCKSSNNFELTIEAIEEAYENAIKANIKVKGVILSNPSNPLGTSLNKATFKSIVNFVNRKNIHLVCDEIYSATIFRGPKFLSLSEILQEMETEENNMIINRNLFHIVYSLSKDMGLPGFRVGIVYSYNDDVVACARKMSSFSLVSSQTQHFLASMLLDDEFIDRFLSENAKRLAKRYARLTEGLGEVGIRCLESNGGLYCWMDLRNMLKDCTVEEEMALWRVIIHDVKLNVSPGSSFHCSEPGWFRACFANMDDETVEIALERIRKFVDSNAPKKKNNKKNLCVSFSPRMYDELVMVMSSPRSPVPQSPLLRATT